MKMLFLISLLIGSVIILSVTLVFRVTSGLTESVEEFLISVNQNDRVKMAGYLSDGFRASISLDELIEWLALRGLGQMPETSWNQREISGGVGTLNGSLTTQHGLVFPAEIILVKESGQWKIHSIDLAEPGLKNMEMPGREQQVILARESVNRFLDSIESGSMEHFMAGISEGWRSQTTLADLNNSYESFFRLADVLAEAKKKTPVIESMAGPDYQGVIQIKGYYDLDEVRFFVELAFITENENWMLHGFYTHTTGRQ